MKKGVDKSRIVWYNSIISNGELLERKEMKIMLLGTKTTNNKYCEAHTSAQGKDFVLIEIYNCTPNGKYCENSVTIKADEYYSMSECELKKLLGL